MIDARTRANATPADAAASTARAIDAQIQARTDSAPRFEVSGASDLDEVRETQQLRWSVFVDEMGARPTVTPDPAVSRCRSFRCLVHQHAS